VRITPAFFLLSILFTILSCPQAPCAEDSFLKEPFLQDDKTPWQITAKSLSYNEAEGVYVAHGDVVITRGDQTLYSQEAVYNMKAGIARVAGEVRLEAGPDTLTGERGFFDLRNQTGKIENGRLFLSENHYYISGEVMEKVAENTYVIEDCVLTTCDGPDPDWTITGSEIWVTIEGYGRVKHAAFRARGLPLFYVPYMIFPAKTRRQTGLLPPRVGYSTRIGTDMELPFFWALSDQTDATFYQRFMSRRGYMQGLEFRYLADGDSQGTFLFDILSDRRKEKDLNDPADAELSPYGRTNRTRYWFRSRVDQDVTPGLVARFDTDLVSDQDYLREFEGGRFGLDARPDLTETSGRPSEESRSPTRRSALRLSHEGEGYSLQALSSYHQRPEDPSEDQTAQPVAGLNFTALPDQIMDVPLFLGIESDYDYVWRDVGQKGQRFSFTPELRSPSWLSGGYLEFEPSINYTHVTQWVNDPDGERDRLNKNAYEAGARLSAQMERVYDVEWWNARRLKHRVSPVLRYTYGGRQGDEDYSPWFEPIESKINSNGIINQISFSLENFLDARLENEKGEVTYRQWAIATLSQAYDIDEERRLDEPERKKKPLLPLSTSLTLRPLPDFDLQGTGLWDHYDHEISSAIFSGEFSMDRSGGREDIYRADYLYIRDSKKDLNLFVDVNLVHGFKVGSSLKRDMVFGYNVSCSYWLGYQSQCWGAILGVKKEDEETSVLVVFRLLGLG
jgi:LPS-assembly protein